MGLYLSSTCIRKSHIKTENTGNYAYGQVQDVEVPAVIYPAKKAHTQSQLACLTKTSNSYTRHNIKIVQTNKKCYQISNNHLQSQL